MLTRPRKLGPRGQRGTALIEFAIVLPLLLLLTLLVMDLTLAFTAKNLLVQAAREGARRAAVQAPPDSVVAVVRQVVGVTALDPNTVTTTISNPTATQVTVSVSAPFTWINPGMLEFFGVATGTSVTLNAACTMALEVRPAGG
jgi:Flp pilus assembly protein TadG